MPLHPWQTLSNKARRRLLKAMRGKGLYWITRLQKREIGILAHQLKIPGRRLKQHFEMLRSRGIPTMQLGEKMVQDLAEVRDLKDQTNVNVGKIRQVLGYKTLEQILNEMREQAQAMAQTQQQKAA